MLSRPRALKRSGFLVSVRARARVRVEVGVGVRVRVRVRVRVGGRVPDGRDDGEMLPNPNPNP